MTLKNGFGNNRYLFYWVMNEKIKTWSLRFPAIEDPNMEKALFDWPIALQHDVKAKYQLISRKFSGMKFGHERSFNQPKATCVCIRSINQSNRSILVRLLFLFCSRVFISRSYENRSIIRFVDVVITTGATILLSLEVIVTRPTAEKNAGITGQRLSFMKMNPTVFQISQFQTSSRKWWSY